LSEQNVDETKKVVDEEAAKIAKILDANRPISITPEQFNTWQSNTQKQIEALPQGSRNFLAFADLVPGIVFSERSDGSTNIRSGALATGSAARSLCGAGSSPSV